MVKQSGLSHQAHPVVKDLVIVQKHPKNNSLSLFLQLKLKCLGTNKDFILRISISLWLNVMKISLSCNRI